MAVGANIVGIDAMMSGLSRECVTTTPPATPIKKKQMMAWDKGGTINIKRQLPNPHAKAVIASVNK